MARECYVYAICNGGHGLYLQRCFTGTRAQCNEFIRNLARAGRPTHFYVVSSLPMDRAERKFLP